MLQKIIDSFLKIDVFRKIYVKFNYFAWQILTKSIKRPFYKLEKIGSDYGGWFVPTELIKSDWICYCAGVGEDITFDLGVIDRFSCHIYAFAPTPKAAAAYVAKTASNQPKFHFFEVGLWSEDKTLKFFAPKNPNHVSHSVVNL